MHRAITVVLSLLFSTLVLAHDPAKPPAGAPDAKTVLQKSAEAMSKLKVVAYDLEYKVSGFFAAFMPSVTGHIVMGKESSDGAKRFRYNAKLQKGDSSEVVEVTAGADGTTYYLIDDKTKTVHADIDPQVMGKHQHPVEFTLTRELGMARPFEDVLKGGEVRYERSEKVDDHDCHVVFVQGTTTPGVNWYFSKSDYLPRRVRFALNGPDGKEGGAGETNIRNFTVEPKLEKDPFALVVPPGYKKTDDFAP